MQSSRFTSLVRQRQGDQPVARIAVAVALGVVVGTATSFAQAHLGLPWAALANSASPWLLGGFAAGAIQVRRGTAIAAGFITCFLEVAAYYLTSSARGFPVSHAWIVFWAACAVLGGPASGWAGWAWRRATGWWQALGASFAASTFLAEGLGAYQLRLHHESSAILFLVIGLTLLVIAARRIRSVALLVCTGALTVVGLVIYGPLLSVLTGTGFTG
jgi:hypothetical protein